MTNVTHWGYTFSELNMILKWTKLPILYLASMSNGAALELGCNEETAELFLQEVKGYYDAK
jgi:hypothetical protein